MTTFTDGPAKGQTLMLKRTPVFLRVVEADGKCDALDQINDEPKATERIHVYKHCGNAGVVHLNFGSKGGGWYPSASYAYYPEQPPDDEARNTADWQAWCRFQPGPHAPSSK